MDIITRFLDAMQALLLAKVALFSLAALGLFIFGVVKKKTWAIVLAIVLGPGQFIMPLLQNLGQERAAESRLAATEAMPRTRLTPDHPRQLVIEGEPPEGLLQDILILREVDRIVVRTGYPGSERSQARIDKMYELSRQDPACRSALRRKWLRMNGWLFFVKQPIGGDQKADHEMIKGCIREVSGTFADDPRHLVLRLDGHATRKIESRNPVGNVVELSLIEPDRETLVEYAELPYLPNQKSAIRLLPDGYDYPCYQLDAAQILLNAFDTARHPDQAAVLRLRPGGDGCVTSPAPVKSKDEEQAREDFRKLQVTRLRGSTPWYVAEADQP